MDHLTIWFTVLISDGSSDYDAQVWSEKRVVLSEAYLVPLTAVVIFEGKICPYRKITFFTHAQCVLSYHL